ncbi:hypothetical protein LTR94_013088 [Friedmanniomyces endolithicus]|nr:hypothetical protein LTR94_013088 [Friedmanniomyces endolithicus]
MSASSWVSIPSAVTRRLSDSASDNMHVGHETSINFENIDRQAVQARQVGEAGAEIIHRDRHLQILEREQQFARLVRIGDDRAFGQFGGQAMAANARIAQRFLKHRCDIVARHLDRRQVDVDADRQGLAEFRVPAAQRLRRFIGGPATERGDETALFRDRHELDRRDMAQFRVVPTRQRFKTGNFAGLEMDQRLIGQGQAAMGERIAQPALDREAALRFLEHAIAINLDLAGALGDLDRRLRLADDIIRIILQMRRQGAADGAIDADLQVGQADRRTQRLPDPLNYLKRVRQAIVQARKNGKIIAADAGQHIALTQAGFQPLGDRDQQFVTSHRAERFIHPAEAAEVDRDNAELGIVRPAAIGEPIVDFLAEAGAVGQRGQAVGKQLAPQILLHRPLAGAIDRGEEKLFGARAGGPQPSERAEKIFRAKLAIAADFETFRIAIRLGETSDARAPFGRCLGRCGRPFAMFPERLEERLIRFNNVYCIVFT